MGDIADVEITPEMIAAGHDALSGHWPGIRDADAEEINAAVREIFLAMLPLARLPSR